MPGQCLEKHEVKNMTQALARAGPYSAFSCVTLIGKISLCSRWLGLLGQAGVIRGPRDLAQRFGPLDQPVEVKGKMLRGVNGTDGGSRG